MQSKYVLGITGFGNYHDNSAVLVKNGKVVFAISEERLTRIKHDASFPHNSIKAALKFGKIKLRNINFVASGWPKRNLIKVFFRPTLFADIIKSSLYLLFFANLRLTPIILKIIRRERSVLAGEERGRFKIPSRKAIFIDHHQAHAVAAYKSSGFKNCLIVTLDGFGTTLGGDLISGSVWISQEGKMQRMEDVPVQASLGLFYEAVTVSLGFKPVDGEGKTMGLAAYGDARKLYRTMGKLAPKFRNDVWVKSHYWLDTLFAVDISYKDVFLETRMGRTLRALIKSYGRKDVAAAAQYLLEKEAVNYFEYLLKKYGSKKIAASGGVFLNVKMNKKIKEIANVEDFFVYPNAGDGGVAAGAALKVYADKYGEGEVTQIKSAALGNIYTPKGMLNAFKRFGNRIYFEKLKDAATYAGLAIARGNVVGWFQGRSEWGPRALGQRSVLADPRNRDVKERINELMKKREWFMPFAPSIQEEHIGEWLLGGVVSPFMTMAFDVKPGKAKKIVAAVHIDNTARPNTVSRKINPLYWKVIESFRKKTGIPLILNTSFNKHGLPIVETPEDAIWHLIWGCVDVLIIGDYLLKRK